MNRLAETNVFNDLGRCAVSRARAGRPSARALLRGLGYSATIAIASCAQPTPQERAQDAAARALRAEDFAFRECIDEVVGAFSAASIEVVRECRAHAREERSS